MLTWFNNLRMGTKLIGTFLVVTILVGGILGILGYYNLNNVNAILLTITDQNVPSIKYATAVERFALRTIMDEKLYLLNANNANVDVTQYYNSAMNNINEIIAALDEVDRVATQYNDQDLLAKSKEVRTVTEQYRQYYQDGAAKLTENSALQVTMADKGNTVTSLAQGYYSEVVGKTDSESMAALPIVIDIWDTALRTRLSQNKYILYKDQAFLDAMNTDLAHLDTLYNDLEKVTTSSANLDRIKQARTATAEFSQAATAWLAKDAELTAVLKNMSEIGTKVQENAMAAEDAGWAAAEASKTTSTGVVSTALTLTIVAVIAAVIIGAILGVTISRSITQPMDIVVTTARALSVGDLQRELSAEVKDQVRKRDDEIGDVGKAFDNLINYMQEMGNAANLIAENDLTQKIKPKSEKDELGNAIAQMIANLSRSVGMVAESANNLTSASSQLAAAANQAGQATNQIASTVQQVAKGTAQQAESVNKTASSVEQMGRAIDGVAKGAQEQASAVGKASNITSQITTAITQVSGNAQAVTRDSAAAADAARKGAVTVQETIQGMEAIKTKVGLSAQKVQEMGQRSDQIGTIVEAIEDIASQTNLLALNAAIEAARAGEHGKGFAVVADEVRKLAERASSATKEIGGLIKGIQTTVAEAVNAMNEGAREVEIGVARANGAGQALNDILKAAEAVYQQADQAASASQRMNVAANRTGLFDGLGLGCGGREHRRHRRNGCLLHRSHPIDREHRLDFRRKLGCHRAGFRLGRRNVRPGGRSDRLSPIPGRDGPHPAGCGG